MLETVITAAGHEVIIYPKFHCELNYIEYFWAAVKCYTGENCSYSFHEHTVLAALDSVSLRTIGCFANRSKRWMEAYINRLTPEKHQFAEQSFKSHRREKRHINV